MNTTHITKACTLAAKALNAGPAITYAIANQVAGPRVATAAYVVATVVDWSVPGIPAGSIAGIAGFGIALGVQKIRNRNGLNGLNAKKAS